MKWTTGIFNNVCASIEIDESFIIMVDLSLSLFLAYEDFVEAIFNITQD